MVEKTRLKSYFSFIGVANLARGSRSYATEQLHSSTFGCILEILSNLVLRNFLVTLKLFLNAKCSLSLRSKLSTGHEKWFLNANLFLIKTFLITMFDCTNRIVTHISKSFFWSWGELTKVCHRQLMKS